MLRVLIVICLLVSACTVQKTVYYDTHTVPKNLNPPENKKSVSILIFNDIRNDVAGNEVYLQKPREIFENKKTYCINSEQHYKKIPLSTQMSMMLVDHLQKRETFSHVFLNKKDSADFIIECNLARLTSKQLLPEAIRSGPAAAGAVGGAIGAGIGLAATSFIKSKYTVSIALTDVKVYDKNMNLLAELGSFANDYEEESNPDAACWCSYNNVKDKLKEFYTEFIVQLESRIEKL
jgi:hypothetical protein